MSTIAQNLASLSQRIQIAAHQANRNPDDVQILAVSKTHSAERIREAFGVGLRDFGESYVQEALPKMDALQDLPLQWHFIGPIQSNKTKPIAEHFQWVHSVDRLKVASRLNEQRPPALEPLNICIQVNISVEATKSGVLHQAVEEFAGQLRDLPRLRLRGLMAIPEKTEDQQQQRQTFAELRQMFADLNQHGFALDTLSMGMTDDLEAAVMEGSTMVRVGTGLFGKRTGK